MAKQNIELGINSTFNGEGFKQLQTSIRGANKEIRSASRVTGILENSLGKLDSTAGSGKIIGFFGSIASMLAKGGVFGAAMYAAGEGISFVIGKLTSVFEAAKKAKKELEDTYKVFAKDGDSTRGYQRRIKAWEDEDRKQKEFEKRNAERRKREVEQSVKDLEKYHEILEDNEILKMKSALITGDEKSKLEAEVKIEKAKADLAVRRAKAEADAARAGMKTGKATPMQWMIADANLKKAEEERQQAYIAAEKKIADFKKKELDAEIAKTEELEKQARAEEIKAHLEEDAANKRKQYEAMSAKISIDGANKVKEIETQIATAKKNAADLEEEAAKARGVSFGDWSRRMRDERHAKDIEDEKQKRRVDGAQKELDRLMKIRPSVLTDWQKNRIADLQSYILNQDPNNNPELAEVARLEELKNRTIEGMAEDLKRLRDAFEAVTKN